MMEREQLKGIARTIADGTKDAQMQLEYARAAKSAGVKELAQNHLMEAERRLAGVAEWKKVEAAMAGDPKQRDPAYEVMQEHYDEWCDRIKREIEAMKMK